MPMHRIITAMTRLRPHVHNFGMKAVKVCVILYRTLEKIYDRTAKRKRCTTASSTGSRKQIPCTVVKACDNVCRCPTVRKSGKQAQTGEHHDRAGTGRMLHLQRRLGSHSARSLGDCEPCHPGPSLLPMSIAHAVSVSTTAPLVTQAPTPPDAGADTGSTAELTPVPTPEPKLAPTPEITPEPPARDGCADSGERGLAAQSACTIFIQAAKKSALYWGGFWGLGLLFSAECGKLYVVAIQTYPGGGNEQHILFADRRERSARGLPEGRA